MYSIYGRPGRGATGVQPGRLHPDRIGTQLFHPHHPYEQQISDNNATPGNAGYLPTVDLSSGFSGTLNNNNNKLSDGTTEKTNGIHNETADIGLNVNWTVFDGLAYRPLTKN